MEWKCSFQISLIQKLCYEAVDYFKVSSHTNVSETKEQLCLTMWKLLVIYEIVDHFNNLITGQNPVISSLPME